MSAREIKLAKARNLVFANLILFSALTAVQAADQLPAAVKALQAQGLEVAGELPDQAGLKVYGAYSGQRTFSLFVTPDGKNVIIGSMFDADGKNISAEPLRSAVAKPLSQQTAEELAKSTWVIDGRPEAPRVIYAFTDPNCPFCHKFWEQSRPWVDDGLVQIRHVMVGILRESSPGKAAAILASADPARALAEHESSLAQGGIAALKNIPLDKQAELMANQSLMSELGAQATPAIFYPDEAGNLKMQMGAPTEANLEKILGKR